MIVSRKGRYGVSVYDKTLGRKRWIGTYATRREAREAELEAMRSSSVQGFEMCGDFAVRWLANYPRKARATRRTYRYALGRFQQDFVRVLLRDLDSQLPAVGRSASLGRMCWSCGRCSLTRSTMACILGRIDSGTCAWSSRAAVRISSP
jgi:hypothetical protein